VATLSPLRRRSQKLASSFQSHTARSML
jgi:hypothetical protein